MCSYSVRLQYCNNNFNECFSDCNNVLYVQESQHKSEELTDEIDALQRRLNSTVALHNEDLNELTRLQQQIKEARKVTTNMYAPLNSY